MKNIISFLKRYSLFILLGFIVAGFYTINLDKNSRFIWDESRALVDMHRIWEQKLITFVGPISEDRLEMFPSLSYYMYMPATVITNFDPLGPAYMAVFYGLLTWLLLTISIVKMFGSNWKSFLLSLFVATLVPVLTTSRWAWNPNPGILWMSLFVFSLTSKNPLFVFLGGVSLGASLYHHYLALFGVLPIMILFPFLFKGRKDRLKRIILTIAGFVLAIVPFAAFEFKNHYFANSFAFQSANEKSFLSLSFTGFFSRFWDGLVIFASSFVPNNLFAIIALLGIFSLIFLIYFKDQYIKYTLSLIHI